MNENKPLYCFKIDEKNATITKHEIVAYREVIHKGIPKIEYFAKLTDSCKSNYKHEFSRYNLDKVNNMRVHSFNPDINNAIAIVNSELVERRDEAYREYSRWNELIIHLNKNMKNQ